MKIQRGFRDKLDKYADINNDLTVSMSVNGSADYDFCCFGVNEAGKRADDRYMIFYNQTQSPQNEIVYSSSGKSRQALKAARQRVQTCLYREHRRRSDHA